MPFPDALASLLDTDALPPIVHALLRAPIDGLGGTTGLDAKRLAGPGIALFVLLSLALFGAIGRSRRIRRREAIVRAREAACSIAGQGMLVVHADGRVFEANAVARRLLWNDPAVGSRLALAEPIRLLLLAPEEQHHTLRIGGSRLIDLSITAVASDHALRGIVLCDVTEDRRGRDHLLQLAHYDSLTGLGNRRLFIDRLKLATQRARARGHAIALLYVDIDRFKEVNDSLGHGAGDELLKSVAQRFRRLAKAWQDRAGRGESFVARLSGDEFAIVIEDFGDPIEIQALATNLVESMGQPVPFEGRTIPCSASVGVSFLPEHGLDVEDLVKAADAALYVAKEGGRGRYVVYEHAFTAQAEWDRKIEKGLRQAIARGELRLAYQPKIDCATGTTAGFEALLRWQSEELGFVNPKDFIPIAEDRGLICEIGAWCIDEACRQLRAWRDAGFEIVPVSVNVSSPQFSDSNLQEVITNALVRHDVDPDAFEIELTESLILQDNETTALTLRDLRAIGVRVALDDFGTGYSALTYLNRFPLDVVKMDRGFLRGIEDDEAAAGIASAVIAMSHSLALSVVAEGVDSERQSKLLRSMGCDQIQGFLYSPALPALEAARFLAPLGGERPRVPTSAAAKTLDRILAADETAAESAGGPTPAEQPTPDGAGRPLALAPAGTMRGSPKADRSAATRVLVVDDDRSGFGQLALRMMRLGADVHLVQGIDEAVVFVELDEPRIDLLVGSVETDLGRLAALRERLEKTNPGDAVRLLLIGEAADDARRQSIRQARVDWLATGPVEDADLRFFIGAARFHGDGPRSQRAIRVPLETMAWIRAGGERRVGTLTSLSRRGAFIESSDPYEVGQSIRVEIKVDGTHVRLFGSVAYCVDGDASVGHLRPAGIGVVFLEPDTETTAQVDAIIERIWTRHLP
ncbi:MAG: EAL domain-containing protein [Myxococcota bacterium]